MAEGLTLAFIFGTVIGSFLNVCIHRLPREESIVFPGSHCPKCQKPIRWYDNLPLLSYAILKGKCRFCRAGISIRYPLVELAAGLLCVAAFTSFRPAYALAASAVLFGLLVVIFTDFDCWIIPDEISLGGILAGLGFSAFFTDWQAGLFRGGALPELAGSSGMAFGPAGLWGDWAALSGGMSASPWTAVGRAMTGVIAGAGVLWVIGKSFSFFLKRDAMGEGDIKLLAGMGAFFGWQGAVFVLLLSSLVGSVAGLPTFFKNRQKEIPYGPYLCLAAGIYLFWGEKIVSWYFNSVLQYPL